MRVRIIYGDSSFRKGRQRGYSEILKAKPSGREEKKDDESKKERKREGKRERNGKKR